ncbi:site-specific integrase [Mucilaginibacter sp. KACC 22063]|uniref:site-specific integrase n=1 Tax=Mucilaginibacter sp. KACC 22063 TaxID=3025666 RepID=UPI0023656978|nr:site-specific integrase [Mucilaginibacter sp. KACC 22063]WDF57164.1 site-specific integrase [Mucilaginibacter sp. KACC 22063]
MKTNFSLLFYMKKQKNYQSGAAPIYMRITVNGKRSEVTTGRECLPERWNAAAGRVNGSKEEIRAFNAYLDDLTQKVYEAHRQLSEANLTISAETIKNKLTGKDDKPRLLIEIFKEHNEQMATLVDKGSYSKGTLTCFETALRHTRDFIKWKYKVNDFDVRNVDHTFVTEYDYFLRSSCNCQNNTAVKNMKNFGKIIRKCEANGWTTTSPFLNYKHTMKRVDRAFLTTDELKRMIDKTFVTERLTQVRDIFVFCCFTGLAFIDVQKLQYNKLVKGLDGANWIQVNRQKTKTPANIPLLPVPLQLIDKYSNHPQCITRGKVFPVLSNQKMNAYLKEITDLCSIDKKVTFHTARHTFATTVTLLNGVPIETVSKMLGHTNLRITQHYAKMLDEKVGADMAILKAKLQNMVIDSKTVITK